MGFSMNSLQFIMRIDKNSHACYESHIALAFDPNYGEILNPSPPKPRNPKTPLDSKNSRSTTPRVKSKGETCIRAGIQEEKP